MLPKKHIKIITNYHVLLNFIWTLHLAHKITITCLPLSNVTAILVPHYPSNITGYTTRNRSPISNCKSPIKSRNFGRAYNKIEADTESGGVEWRQRMRVSYSTIQLKHATHTITCIYSLTFIPCLSDIDILVPYYYLYSK